MGLMRLSYTNTILTMKEDSKENEIWREGGGNIKAHVWWRRSVEATCGGR